MARVYMYADWARIAVDNYATGKGCDARDGYRKYLTSIVASAIAIESFKLDLPLQRPTGRTPCTVGEPTAHAHGVNEWLTANFSGTPGTWHDELHWLFELRDNAVHYMGSLQPLYKHPDGTHYPPVVGIYDQAAANRAISLAQEILLHCLDHPVPGNAELVALVGSLGGAKGLNVFDGF
ncbi:MAG: hypothetical protein ACYDA2_05280 [Acidimicrobiales bacterium]